MRINIKSGKIEKLAHGNQYVLKGDIIYYQKTKYLYDKEEYCYYHKPLGIYSMKLDGSNEKKSSNIKLKWNSEPIVKVKMSGGTLITKWNDSDSRTDLIFKSKTQKTIAKKINRVIATNDKYIIYTTSKTTGGVWYVVTYLIDTNGKKIKQLTKYIDAGT